MTQRYQQAGVSLYCADVMDALPTFAEASFDACFCDPPYGLTDKHGCRSPQFAEGGKKHYGETVGGFMGMKWDHAVPRVECWRQVYRVLKPGAPLLVFGGTRTHHRLMCAIEDAGFDLKDCLMWIHSQGFPKSTAIDKQIDKRRDDSVDALKVTRWLNEQVKRSGKNHRDILQHFGFNEGSGQIGHWTALSHGAQPAVPTWEQWQELKQFLGLSADIDAEVWRLNGRKGKPGEAWDQREVIGHSDRPPGWFTSGDGHDITAPATDAAKRWAGYGTALKPSFEILVLAMKPCDGTFAESALKWGVAGLNIDGCRIKTSDNLNGGAYAVEGRRGSLAGDARIGAAQGMFEPGKTSGSPFVQPIGRWPANLVLSCACDGDHEPDCPVRMLDEQSGNLGRSSGGGMKNADKYGGGYAPPGVANIGFGDSGSASRFFYCAKASRSEREAGLKGRIPCVKCGGLATDTHIDDEGRTVACHRNGHPTVKPLDLCRYMAKLILPPARETPRRLLVPFAGSGSEMIGAQRAGWDEIVGIEIDEGYCKVAEARLDAEAPPLQREVERCDRELAEARQLLLEGHPDVSGLTMAISDWSEERRMLEAGV